MSQPFECPRCHFHADVRGSGWQSRSCPACGNPLVLASGPAEELVRKYLHRDRPAQLGAPPPGARRG